MTSSAYRLQARCAANDMILPDGVEPGRWYDVRPGRRESDQREGKVVLDVGANRVLLPASCLEFRTCTRTLRDLMPSAHAIVRTAARAARRVLEAHPAVAVASALPLGFAAILLAGRLAQR